MDETKRRLTWWRLLWGVLVSPGKTFRALEQELSGPCPPRWLVALPVGVGCVWSFVYIYWASDVLFPSVESLPALLLLNVPIVPLYWLALTGTIDLLCRWGSGKGTFRRLQMYWGYCYLPSIISMVISGLVQWVMLRSGNVSLATPMALISALGVSVHLVVAYHALGFAYHGSAMARLVSVAVVLTAVGRFAVYPVFVPQYNVSVNDLAIMEPTFRISESIRIDYPSGATQGTRANRLASIHRGDVVFFRAAPLAGGTRQRTLLGRVVGLPGEDVVERGWNVHLPECAYLILGDNPAIPAADYGGGIVEQDRICGRMLRAQQYMFRIVSQSLNGR